MNSLNSLQNLSPSPPNYRQHHRLRHHGTEHHELHGLRALLKMKNEEFATARRFLRPFDSKRATLERRSKMPYKKG